MIFVWSGVFVALCVFYMRGVDAVCEPMKSSMCTNMPYNLTVLPNVFQHATQENAMLAIEQYQPLVNTGCSKVLSFFLCTMYFPVCTVLEKPVKPCRSLCEEAKSGCLPIMMRYNVSWPDNLACEDLPLPEQGLCVQPQSIVHDPSSTPPKDIIAQTKPETEMDDTNPGRRPGGRRQDRRERRKQKKQKKSERESDQEGRPAKEERKRQRQEKRLAKKERKQKRQRRLEEKKVTTDVVAEGLVQDQDGAADTTKAPPLSTAANQPCVCQPPRQIKKELKTKHYSYKIKAAWSGLERSADGSTLMKFKLMDAYHIAWPNQSNPEKGDIITLHTNKTCICPRFKENRPYLVAGYGLPDSMTYDVALKWKPILKKWVEKGNGGKNEKNLRKERKQKQKERRRQGKPERKQKEERRKNPKKNKKGHNDDDPKKQEKQEKKRQQKKEKRQQKMLRKEERKERRKEKKRRKQLGTTEVPLVEWTATKMMPTEKPAV